MSTMKAPKPHRPQPENKPHENAGHHRFRTFTVSLFPQVIRGAATVARERGYTLIAVNWDDDGDRQNM